MDRTPQPALSAPSLPSSTLCTMTGRYHSSLVATKHQEMMHGIAGTMDAGQGHV